MTIGSVRIVRYYSFEMLLQEEQEHGTYYSKTRFLWVMDVV